jgi:hypothetical protein
VGRAKDCTGERTEVPPLRGRAAVALRLDDDGGVHQANDGRSGGPSRDSPRPPADEHHHVGAESGRHVDDETEAGHATILHHDETLEKGRVLSGRPGRSFGDLLSSRQRDSFSSQNEATEERYVAEAVEDGIGDGRKDSETGASKQPLELPDTERILPESKSISRVALGSVYESAVRPPQARGAAQGAQIGHADEEDATRPQHAKGLGERR